MRSRASKIQNLHQHALKNHKGLFAVKNLEKQFISVGNIQLHVVMAGSEDGEPLFLLHGFPEFWYGWKNQISFLAEQGYRVIVPDQRGYNLSDKPDGIGNYTLDILAQDVINLATALGYEKINLIGHDWGGIVAWWVATLFPDKLKKLIILNAPYPSIMTNQVLEGNIAQWLKSWYIVFFQIPFLPETLVSLNDYESMANSLQQSSKSASFSDEDIEKYRRAWSQPGAMTAMLNWYRAIARNALKNDLHITPCIVTPTLLLWGEKDKYLSKELAELSIAICDDGELIFYPTATHWLQHDEAQSINQEIHHFLQQAIIESQE